MASSFQSLCEPLDLTAVEPCTESYFERFANHDDGC